ncbi:hypothetical protein LWI29_016861 [Acer saccharum]|uniref:LIM zinc-binding domain-containing protein n=1 Tax=Acer saccharum TaxID=4024 RepID=A0AA39SA59_ACESA|nr:hypothetical protein LWI29_016861 [Acer saccharum]
MGFSGTQEKCKACDKTVHFIDMLTADGVSYHKTCFKCSHCNGVLVMSSYSSMDGVLYCKPHFEQLFRESKTFQAGSHKQGGSGLTKVPSKVSSMFCGTQEKCSSCKKTVYPLEKVTVEGEFYHKCCFRCAHGGCSISPSNYAALDGILYCKHHFAQLFKEKGSYNHLNKTVSMKKNGAAVPAEENPEAESAAAEEKPKQEVESEEKAGEALTQ